MLAISWRAGALASAAFLILLGGCVVPKSQVAELSVRNQNLAEQSRAQLAEIENLRVHCRSTEDQLQHAEEELALLEKRLGLDDEQLASYRAERETLHRQFVDAVNGKSWISPALATQLAQFSKQHPELKFDPCTGIAKLDSDILFDSGKAELKPGAERLLRKMSSLLKRPETRDLRVMVVGHTDDRHIVRLPGREIHADNLDLSTARAMTVANRLRGLGLKSGRIGIAGFGAHQPVAANASPRDRYKNRRVEIFVMVPDVPVVGWTETTPTVY